MTTMTERPILFSGAMVKAILDDRKTQTRRVVKRQTDAKDQEVKVENGWLMYRRAGLGWWNDQQCPYGHPGGRLWVRETWQYNNWTEDGYPFIGYRADGTRLLCDHYAEEWGERIENIWAELSKPENYNIDQRAADRRWRPAIHMPRWACRQVLEITDVRVERLRAISDDDAKAEGVLCDMPGHGADCGPRGLYAQLWDSINAKRGFGWDKNPWVWVVVFKRIQQN